MITVGILVSYLTGLVFAGSGHWRTMLMLGVVPAIVTFGGMIGAVESPRWLVLRARSIEAAGVLGHLQPDLSQVQIDRMAKDIEARTGETPGWGRSWRLRCVGLLSLQLMAFLLQQISRINAVIYLCATDPAQQRFREYRRAVARNRRSVRSTC